MNAYELADILHQSDFLAMDFADDAATMLRQQADRIAELEKSHIELEKGILKKLNQEMMSKPVAWINEQMDYIIHNNWKENTANPDAHYYTIPLYTHSIKQLSDEEILQQAEWTFGTYFFECIDDPYWIEFARAIIKEITE